MADKGYPQVAVTMQPTPMVVPQLMFGPEPMQVTCGNCQKVVMTTTVTENGACAWIAALIVCLFCCPCFWIPLVMDSCKDVNHTCPACGSLLGRFKKI